MIFSEDRVRFICDWLEENKPDKDCDFYKMWISIEILRVLVDNEWTNQAIFPNNYPTTSAAVREAINQQPTGMIPNPNDHMQGDVRRGPPSVSDRNWQASALGSNSIK